MSLFLLIGVYHLAASNLEVDYIPDVMAATQTTTPSAACTDPLVAEFQGDLDFTITWGAAAAPAASSPSATAVISAAVGGQAAPAVTATLNAAGAPAGSVLLTTSFPDGKLGGLQCQTTVDDLKLEANGDGVNNASFEVYLGNIADADNAFTASDQVDTAAATAKDVLYGTSGQISGTLLLDGTRDVDAVQNGEIIWGSSTEANGGMELKVTVDAVEYNPAAGTDTETITITATSS